MSLSTAQKLAWSLATSLVVCITLFKAADGYGVCRPPSSMVQPTASSMNTTRSPEWIASCPGHRRKRKSVLLPMRLSGYTLCRAMVVVEARPFTSATEPSL